MSIICIKEGRNYASRFYYTDAFGNKKRKYKSGFPNQKKALAWENAQKEMLKQTTPEGSIPFRLFVSQVWEPSRERLGISIATLEKYSSYVPKIVDRIGHLPLNKITEQNCQAIIDLHKKHPCVAQEYKKALNCIFNYAKHKRYITATPMEYVETPTYKPKKIVPYSFETIANVLTKMKEQNSKLYTPFLLDVLFSMTREEVLALTDDDLNWQDYSITVNKALVEGMGQKQIKEQKTENRQRVLYANKEIFDEIYWYKKTNCLDTKFVCCNRNGTQMMPNTLSTCFPAFIKKHGFPKVTFHGHRHTFSNLSKRIGVDGDTIYRMMGHSAYEVTVENYNSADPALIRNATTKLFDGIKSGQSI